MPRNSLIGKLALAYAAGIVDGEGSVCLIKSYRKDRQYFRIALSVSIGNTNEWLLSWFKMQFGGSVYPCKLGVSSRKPAWVWSIHSRRAVDFLGLLLPYLQIKRPQAELAIQFQKKKSKGKYGRSKKPETENALEEADRILMKSFNSGGKKNADKGII